MNIAVLGSTGSIGTQALDVARLQNYKLTALTANGNIKLLENQIREFSPEFAAVADETLAKELRLKVADTDTRILAGTEGICQCAALDKNDIVLNSIVGIAGLLPSMSAINAGKNIALANKETLVTGGKIVMEAAKRNGVSVLPVDSEHSAIFQCLNGENRKRLKKIILTASGGPFYGFKSEDLMNITPEKALRHPNWNMGAKITIDSSTLMNKGLEFIEAMWLFDAKPEQIEIVIHRQSIVHSMVEFEDNAVIAQLGKPDMRIPIQYALTYPDRIESPVDELTLADYSNLTFAKPDVDTFSCLKTAITAAERGGLVPCAVNAANEVAVKLFLERKITYPQIAELVKIAETNQSSADYYSASEVFEADRNARQLVYDTVGVEI